jgi:hypothetical protein
VDEDGLARHGAGLLEEGAVGGRVGRVDAGALLEGDASGQAVRLRLGAQRQFGVGARQAPRHVDALARGDARHALADGRDDARPVEPRRVRQRGPDGVRAAADVRVDRVDARGGDAHQNLPRPRPRVFHLLRPQNLRPAELSNSNRLHQFLQSEGLATETRRHREKTKKWSERGRRVIHLTLK